MGKGLGVVLIFLGIVLVWGLPIYGPSFGVLPDSAIIPSWIFLIGWPLIVIGVVMIIFSRSKPRY